MRVHLGLAALILIGGIVAGWWFGRTPDGPKTPIEARNSVAAGKAVVVTYHRPGSNAGVPATITFLKGEGWVWEEPPGDGASGSTVVSTSSETLAAAAAGCYIAIPEITPPAVPGITLARDLEHAPGLKHEGDTYTYTFSSDDDGNDAAIVTEDLSTIAVAQSYTANVMVTAVSPGSALLAGSYLVRSATDEERDRAEQLLSDAHASPVATFTVQQRPVVAGQAPQYGALQMVSPRDCPAAIVINPDVIGASAAPSLFTETNAMAVIGAPVQVAGGQMIISGVLPVHEPIDASAEEILASLQGETPQTLPFARGTTFATVARSPGATPAIMSISSCQAAEWLPC